MGRHIKAGVVLLSLVGAFAASRCVQAGVVWDESVNGPLSGNRLAPTNLSLLPGPNSLTATVQAGVRDYVHFSLPAGASLTAINHISWTSVDPQGFIGVQPGSTFTEDPLTPNVANILGYTHFGTGPGTVGTDILPQIGTGAGAIGFTPPLSGADYTFWIQQTSANTAKYQLDFVVSPEPGSAALLGVGLFGGLLRRKRAIR